MQNKHVHPIRRVTGSTVAVLDALLSHDEPVWGLLLAREVGKAPGGIYPILNRLEAAGWVTPRWEDDAEPGRPRRRLYVLTELGAREAAATSAAYHARQVRTQPGRATEVGLA